MRHSSWTLFLVPLTLPLVLIFFPWAMRSLDQLPSWGEQPQELVQEVRSVDLEDPKGGSGTGEEATPKPTEALFK